jgi:hypothetical protein
MNGKIKYIHIINNVNNNRKPKKSNHKNTNESNQWCPPIIFELKYKKKNKANDIYKLIVINFESVSNKLKEMRKQN